MTGDRWVVLGLAPARTPWFSTVAQWSNAGTLPVEYVKCLSTDELRVRLRSGRPASAVLVDARVPGLDRDLLAEVAKAGCLPIVVGADGPAGKWAALGAGATIADLAEPQSLLDALGPARRITRSDAALPDAPPAALPSPAAWHAKVAAVCGSGGTGSSTVAMALAQGLGRDPRNGDLVLLADLARHGDLGMLHDATDVVPAVQELVEAHRFGTPSHHDVHGMTFHLPERGYSLLLGLRRPAAWSTVAPHAFAAAFDGLQRAFRVVVCDIDADLEGEADGGSVDVEDRNVMARTAAARADVVFAVGLPGVKGMHSLVRVIRQLDQCGVPFDRVQPVVNRAPRSPRTRAELTAALAALLPEAADLASPLFLAERRVDECIQDARPMPAALTGPLAGAWRAALNRTRPNDVGAMVAAGAPERVTPGSLGHWADEDTEVV